MIPYRVFISYSHDKDDEELVHHISENLEQEGLTVMWDQKFSVGTADYYGAGREDNQGFGGQLI